MAEKLKSIRKGLVKKIATITINPFENYYVVAK